MQVGCPQCQSRFSIPDTALGAAGRTLKCARCGHKWFQTPVAPPPPPPRAKADAFDFGLEASSFPPPPIRREPEMDPAVEPISDFGPGPLRFSDPAPTLAAAAAHAFDPRGSDMDDDMDDGPSFTVPPRSKPTTAPKAKPVKAPKTKRGHLGLMILLGLLLLLIGGGFAYLRQDKLIDLWPPLETYLLQAGLRREMLGAGLELRTAGAPERTIVNETNVLIARGIVANVSDRTRVIPFMKLQLEDATDKVVQEKIEPPPVAQLDPGGSASFKIVMERPDANAVKLEILWAEKAEK